MPQDNRTGVLALGVAVLIATLYYTRKKKKIVAPFPPGPRGLPILGNAADLPQSLPWLTFSRWAKEHGPIVHLRILGKSIIILNDVNYAIDMLDKKSRVYSNRPNLVMGGTLVGWDEGPALIQFGKTWSDYRRLMAQFLGTRSKVETAYNDIFEKATHAYLCSLLQSPNMWKEHGYRFAGAIVLKIAYGYQADDHNDPLVKLVDEAMDQFSEMTAPNAFAVDVFPFLRFVPQWFPGASWKKKVGHYHKTLQNMLDTPYEWVKKQMASYFAMGASISCVVSDLLDSNKSTGEEERLIKWAAAGIYSAVIETFFLALILHPDAQRKAQAELDTVLGHCTAPRLTDRPRLPFTDALISEILRTYTIGPVGLPHVAAEDDVHEGFLIPKGAIIITNNWLFYRDRNTYADPETFRPERFMETASHVKEKDPKDILFGYGRSNGYISSAISPSGVHLADMTMWLLFTSILVFFDISPAIEDGKQVLPSGRFSDGSISRPEQFNCTITAKDGAEDSEFIARFSDL
ncbi:cytochrome P450 [Mycena rosella]|uniref:Cytochrome P450 n=1 Tax=Mycena rosella TaxID=1033263 RepID=A0AAD7MB22_MYCRO|nr:cytochrome P450 [Mycena rosella]